MIATKLLLTKFTANFKCFCISNSIIIRYDFFLLLVKCKKKTKKKEDKHTSTKLNKYFFEKSKALKSIYLSLFSWTYLPREENNNKAKKKKKVSLLLFNKK